jgi:hypothetical protein
LGKEKCVLEKEKGVFKGSEKVKQFRTKFESYKVIYFGTKEVLIFKPIQKKSSTISKAREIT